MSASDLAAVIIAVVSLAAVAAMAVALVSLTRSVRALRETVDTLRSETIPTVIDLRDTVHRANDEIHRVEGLIDTAESITTTVDSASRLTARALSPVLIKVLSFTAGVGRAGRRLRRPGRTDRVIDVAAVAGDGRVPARRREEVN